ncbi:MAG: hypothetical protein LBP35_05515 [Candidatus Ancillula trichonymphae]|nr:hypothetical protein [Candidatus Ancillula trichonymphae]
MRFETTASGTKQQGEPIVQKVTTVDGNTTTEELTTCPNDKIANTTDASKYCTIQTGYRALSVVTANLLNDLNPFRISFYKVDDDVDWLVAQVEKIMMVVSISLVEIPVVAQFQVFVIRSGM